MAAVASRESSDHELIGQSFDKASPILTWRPVKVQRITPTPPRDMDSDARGSAEDASGGDPFAERFSRAATKRMVAWPVMPGVRAARAKAARALLTLVAFALLCGAALTVCIYVLFAEGPSAAITNAQSVRVGVRHVTTETFDSLLPATPAVAAPAEPATSVPSHKPATTWHPRHAKAGVRSAHASAHSTRPAKVQRG